MKSPRKGLSDGIWVGGAPSYPEKSIQVASQALFRKSCPGAQYFPIFAPRSPRFAPRSRRYAVTRGGGGSKPHTKGEGSKPRTIAEGRQNVCIWSGRSWHSTAVVKTCLVGHGQYFWPSSAPVWYCPLNPSIFEKYTKGAFGSVTFIFDDSAHSSQKYPGNTTERDRNTAQDGGFF